MDSIKLESIDNSLKSIEKSLNTLVEDTKATKEIKALDLKNRYTKDDVKKEVVLFFILGIFAGCMLFQLGIDLLK